MFLPLLNQMAFLFSLIILGYILARFKLIPDNSDRVLSKLENYLFIPALILGTFIENFTVNKLKSAGQLLLFSVIVELMVIPLSLICARLCTKDKYLRNIFAYGLAFSNFAFMGNAIVKSMFPDVFLEYIIFTLVLWIGIYVFGVPCLLIGQEGETGLKSRLKSFLNPMFICALVGMVLGLTALPVPSFAGSVISSLGDCMSPVAMLITGVAISKINLKNVLKIKSVYAISALRLVVFPLIFIGIYYLFGLKLDRSLLVCTVVSLAMPLGLNTIVIPSAYGKDTTAASGMALISHVLSILTIPIIFTLITI